MASRTVFEDTDTRVRAALAEVPDISDAVSILGYLFLGGPPGPCLDAMDTNDAPGYHAVYLLNFLFAGGPPPPEPHERPGTDPTGDAIDCRGY